MEKEEREAVLIIQYQIGVYAMAYRLHRFIHDDVYDSTKFETAYNFHPTVSLAEGIRREVDYLKSKTKK